LFKMLLVLVFGVLGNPLAHQLDQLSSDIEALASLEEGSRCAMLESMSMDQFPLIAEGGYGQVYSFPNPRTNKDEVVKVFTEAKDFNEELLGAKLNTTLWHQAMTLADSWGKKQLGSHVLLMLEACPEHFCIFYPNVGTDISKLFGDPAILIVAEEVEEYTEYLEYLVSQQIVSRGELNPVVDEGIAMLFAASVDPESDLVGWADIPEVAAFEVIRQAALGLQYMENRGKVHRDIKPANLMVDSAGHVTIVDLGLVEREAATKTALRHNLGSSGFMAPELSSSAPIAKPSRIDVYALGVTFYELLTAHPLRIAENTEAALRLLQSHTTLDVQLKNLCRIMMKQDPELRPTATELNGLIAGMQKAYPNAQAVLAAAVIEAKHSHRRTVDLSPLVQAFKDPIEALFPEGTITVEEWREAQNRMDLGTDSEMSYLEDDESD